MTPNIQQSYKVDVFNYTNYLNQQRLISQWDNIPVDIRDINEYSQGFETTLFDK